MFILKKGHQPGVYVPLMALFLVQEAFVIAWPIQLQNSKRSETKRKRRILWKEKQTAVGMSCKTRRNKFIA